MFLFLGSRQTGHVGPGTQVDSNGCVNQELAAIQKFLGQRLDGFLRNYPEPSSILKKEVGGRNQGVVAPVPVEWLGRNTKRPEFRQSVVIWE